MLQIQLFGEFSVRDAEGNDIAIAGAKTQGLVAFLALTMEMPPSRDRLISLFWGDRFTEQARQSLRQAVAKLRRIFEAAGLPDVVIADPGRIGLNQDQVSVDVESFLKLAQQTDPSATAAAVELLKGPLLEGFYGQQSEFEDWLASERQRVAELSSQVMERAASQASQKGDVRRALEIARRVAELDPWSDSAQTPLIRILAQKGDRAAAVQHFNAYERTLREELGIGPGPDLAKLVDQVKGEGFFPEATEPAHPAPERKKPVRFGGRTAVAISQFTWLASETDQSFLVEGIVEDVGTKLARFSWLDVKAASTEDASNPAPDADYLLRGSLRSQSNRYRLTVQLVDPTDGRYLWVERFDRQTDDLFGLQDEISDTIVGSLEAVLERLAGRGAREVAFEETHAWDCYHRGLAIQYEFDATTNGEAQRYFRRAITLDPNFGLAYARLSYAIVISVIYLEAANVEDLLDEALTLARHAARLEPNDAVARFALGRAHLARGEYSDSIAQLRISTELNPSMAQAHCGLGDSMAYSGDLENALGCFEEAVRISPTDPYRWAFLSYGAMAFLFRGDFEDAEDWAAKAEAVPNSHYWPTAIRASALAHAGKEADARKAIEKLIELRPGITCDFVRERLFYLRDPKQVDTYIAGLAKAGLA